MTDEQREADRFSLKPLFCSLAVAVASAGTMRFVGFVPCGSGVNPFLGLVRGFLSVGYPMVILAALVYAAYLAVSLIVTLVRWRWLRALSKFVALSMLPVAVSAILVWRVFDPYFWLVRMNAAAFEAQAKAEALGGSPVFATLERRDVSTGFVGNPLTFTTLVYDETDELGLDPSMRSVDWLERYDKRLSSDLGGDPMSWDGSASHLMGHFYLITVTCCG